MLVSSLDLEGAIGTPGFLAFGIRRKANPAQGRAKRQKETRSIVEQLNQTEPEASLISDFPITCTFKSFLLFRQA